MACGSSALLVADRAGPAGAPVPGCQVPRAVTRPDTRNGLGGGIVALIVGVIAVVLGALARTRVRRVPA
ncbi:DUF6223 family protein [Streptodolium elevatio]|uniref:DUF6223 family protein n=1 Tax=Streptodolium elevatio TaxID=3157996 RepID=A0ABV3DWF3_9ACTN